MNYASFWLRALAHLIDFVLLNAIEYALEWSISTPLGLSAFQEQLIGVVISFALAYGYYVELPLRKGTTFGKRCFDIYVVDFQTAAPMNRKQALTRLASYLLSYLIVGCGFLMAAFHPEKRALHDLIAGTVCIRKKK